MMRYCSGSRPDPPLFAHTASDPCDLYIVDEGYRGVTLARVNDHGLT